MSRLPFIVLYRPPQREGRAATVEDGVGVGEGRDESNGLSPAELKGLWALIIAMFSVNFGVGMIIPLLPIYSEAMGASGLMIGLIYGANPFVRGASMLTFGSLADRRGKKMFLELGMTGYLLAAVGFVFASTPIHLLSLRVGQGLLSAMIAPVARAYAGQLSPARFEGRIMGMINAGFFAGFAAGPLVGGVLADGFGMTAPFMAMAMLSGAAAIMVYLFVPDQGPAAVGSGGPKRTERDRYFEMMRNDTVRGILAIRSSVAMGRGIFSALLPIFAQGIVGLSSAQVGLVVSVRPLLSAVLQPGFGRVADRHNRKWLAVGGFLLAPLAFFLVPWTSNLAQLLLLACLLGLSTGISVPAATSIAVDRGREYGMGRIMGLEGMWQSFAMAIGSTAGGAFLDGFGYSNAFRAAGAIGFAGIGLSLYFLRNYQDTHLIPRPVAEGD